MRNKGGREDVKCLDFSSLCGDRRSFFSEIDRRLENMRFCFRSTPAEWIGLVYQSRRGAANILILLVLHQYIGAAHQLAPIY
jgi:hypothetical protein